MSQHCQNLIYGKQKTECKFCGEEYEIAKSDAWEVESYCCGECEHLDEAGDWDEEEPEE